MELSIGQIFLNWNEFQNALEDWAIQDQFQFNVVRKDKKRAQYKCQHSKSGCQWRLFISYNSTLELEIKTLTNKHSCAGMGLSTSSTHAANQQSWLRRIIPLHLLVTKTTKVQEIIDCIRMQYGQTTSYRAALNAKSFLLNDKLEDQIQQFQRIPQYLTLLQKYHPDIYTDLQLEPNTAFQRVFICPRQSRDSFQHMRRFLAVDGTFLKARFVQTLLLAVGIDANGKNLPLAWGVVESENKDSWTWFFTHLKTAIPEIIGATIISDRDKGLLIAEEEVFNHTLHSLICCFHLKGIVLFI